MGIVASVTDALLQLLQPLGRVEIGTAGQMSVQHAKMDIAVVLQQLQLERSESALAVWRFRYALHFMMRVDKSELFDSIDAIISAIHNKRSGNGVFTIVAVRFRGYAQGIVYYEVDVEFCGA